MAVRGTSLGGTDFTFGESPLKSADLNDTINWETILAHFGASSLTPLIDFTNAGDTVTLTRGTVYRFKSFTMSSGTIQASGGTAGEPVIILVDGDVSFTGGTIDLIGDGYAGGAQQTTTPAAGNAGSDFTYLNTSYGQGNGAGGGGGSAPASPGAGASATTFTYFDAADQPDTILNFMNVIAGAGGGSGGGGNEVGAAPSGVGGAGGAGGGVLIFLSGGALNFGASATIDVSGVAGSNGGNESGGNPTGAGGGGGGGGGGMIVLGCGGSLTDAGTATVDGGAAGSGGTGSGSCDGSGGGGSGGGGAGGQGSAGSNGQTAAEGGDGGAGGAGGAGIKETFTW